MQDSILMLRLLLVVDIGARMMFVLEACCLIVRPRVRLLVRYNIIVEYEYNIPLLYFTDCCRLLSNRWIEGDAGRDDYISWAGTCFSARLLHRYCGPASKLASAMSSSPLTSSSVLPRGYLQRESPNRHTRRI